jgi:arylsulfatase A-like enzyme
MPKVYRGVEQFPLSGVSMKYTFDAPDSPTHKERQFYMMYGTRGIWEKGWKAASVHAPFTGKGHIDQDRWQLYQVDADRLEATDLAKQYPEKLEALKKLWFEEATINLALPIDDRTPMEMLTIERSSAEPKRDR